jgi:hypothetical protein
MNNIPNGGFPPLKIKKQNNNKEKHVNNKERGFSKKIQPNIRQILLNTSKTNILEQNKVDNKLYVVTDL